LLVGGVRSSNGEGWSERRCIDSDEVTSSHRQTVRKGECKGIAEVSGSCWCLVVQQNVGLVDEVSASSSPGADCCNNERVRGRNRCSLRLVVLAWCSSTYCYRVTSQERDGGGYWGIGSIAPAEERCQDCLAYIGDFSSRYGVRCPSIKLYVGLRCLSSACSEGV